MQLNNLYHKTLCPSMFQKTRNLSKRGPKVCKYICIGKCVSKLIAHLHKLLWATNQWLHPMAITGQNEAKSDPYL